MLLCWSRWALLHGEGGALLALTAVAMNCTVHASVSRLQQPRHRSPWWMRRQLVAAPSLSSSDSCYLLLLTTSFPGRRIKLRHLSSVVRDVTSSIQDAGSYLHLSVSRRRRERSRGSLRLVWARVPSRLWSKCPPNQNTGWRHHTRDICH